MNGLAGAQKAVEFAEKQWRNATEKRDWALASRWKQEVEKAEQKVEKAEQKVEKAEQKVKEAEQKVKEAEQKVKEAKQEVKEAKQEVKEAGALRAVMRCPLLCS